jgi:hypothetical protein
MTRSEVLEGLRDIRWGQGVDSVTLETIHWAIELLAPQEARLVTREDFQQAPAYDGVLPCWKENRKPTRRSGWVAIVYGKALQDTETGMVRYWTGVPTEEQRREMAWPGA